MKSILAIPIIVLSLIFELTGRLLAQIASVSMSIAVMLLGTVNKTDE